MVMTNGDDYYDWLQQVNSNGSLPVGWRQAAVAVAVVAAARQLLMLASQFHRAGRWDKQTNFGGQQTRE